MMTAESERRRQATERKGQQVRQVTPTAEGGTRQAGDANSGVGEARVGDQKERTTIQAGEQKE